MLVIHHSAAFGDIAGEPAHSDGTGLAEPLAL